MQPVENVGQEEKEIIMYCLLKVRRHRPPLTDDKTSHTQSKRGVVRTRSFAREEDKTRNSSLHRWIKSEA